MTHATITFIGAGNMATSLIGGLVERGYPADHIWACDPSEVCRNAAAALGVNVTEDNSLAVNQANIVVIAVKPQVLKEVITPLQAAFASARPMVLSIAAGIPMASLEQWLGEDLPVVRCMPNTPALLQEGATGLYANKHVSEQNRALATEILNAVGISLWVDSEADLDTVIAVSGSGPAYFFLLLEAMQNVAEEMGLSAEVAAALAQQTAKGAARMALEGDVEVAELRRRVSSPGGTTEQAILTFERGGFRELVRDAMVNCVKRAEQMAIEMGD
ncbi:MAG: pyrroline-5-carboxylate reductase [Pseudomonadales bacterium]